MKTQTVCLIALLILAGCGAPKASPTSTPNPPTSAPAQPTAAPVPTIDKPIDRQAENAGDWAKMSREQRDESAKYWIVFWQKATGKTYSQSPAEVVLCISEDIINRNLPNTMVIMVLSSRCLEGK